MRNPFNCKMCKGTGFIWHLSPCPVCEGSGYSDLAPLLLMVLAVLLTCLFVVVVYVTSY